MRRPTPRGHHHPATAPLVLAVLLMATTSRADAFGDAADARAELALSWSS